MVKKTVTTKKSQEHNIFSALSHKTRRKILTRLYKKPKKVSQIARELSSTIQAIQKHIEMLSSLGMISKDQTGKLYLTAVGQGSIEQISNFTFLSDYKDYFADHSFEGIPQPLIHRIGELENSEFISNAMEGWQKGKQMVENTKKSFWGFSTLAPIEFFDIAIKKIKKGVTYKLIFQQNTIVPKGFEKKRKDIGWHEAIKKGLVEEKYVKKLPITVAVTEKEGQMVFANKNTGQIDANAMFYSTDESFRNWCRDLFRHYWEEVPKIRTPKFKET